MKDVLANRATRDVSSRMEVHSVYGKRYGQVRALLLISSLLFPFAQLAVSSSQNSESLLPACCRAHGKHKCSLEQHGSSESSTHQVAQIGEKCPCTPALASS